MVFKRFFEQSREKKVLKLWRYIKHFESEYIKEFDGSKMNNLPDYILSNDFNKSIEFLINNEFDYGILKKLGKKNNYRASEDQIEKRIIDCVFAVYKLEEKYKLAENDMEEILLIFDKLIEINDFDENLKKMFIEIEKIISDMLKNFVRAIKEIKRFRECVNAENIKEIKRSLSFIKKMTENTVKYYTKFEYLVVDELKIMFKDNNFLNNPMCLHYKNEYIEKKSRNQKISSFGLGMLVLFMFAYVGLTERFDSSSSNVRSSISSIQNGIEYKVHLNDSLHRIAKRFNYSWMRIWAVNPNISNPDLIKEGTKIIIRAPTQDEINNFLGKLQEYCKHNPGYQFDDLKRALFNK